MGLTRNFHGKKGGPWIFLRSEGGPRKIFAINIFCIRPPLISVCERSLRPIFFYWKLYIRVCFLNLWWRHWGQSRGLKMFGQNWWRRKSCQITVHPKHNTLQPLPPKNKQTNKETNKNKQNQRKINHYKSKTKQYEKQTNKTTKQNKKHKL